MLANMASSLIIHKRITTTTAKAKALRSYIEPLITKSKNDTTHSRRVVFSYLQDKDAVSELFRDVAGKIAERPGGYTRILKIGSRLGDSAEMAIIELVDYNQNLLAEGAEQAKSRRKRRGGAAKKKSDDQPKAEKSAAVQDAEIVEEKQAVAEVNTEEPVVEETKAEEASEEVKAETESENEEQSAEEDKEDKENKES
jgi:large subunit ribosomal protein L17